jgi:alpha-beta hydrolase superfamily lysophospholipase
VLPARGFAALAIDHWGFGERSHPGERVLNKRLLWNGSTLWGMRVADTLAAFDWLRQRFPEAPVIAMGISMGSTMAWWSAALESGIAGCVDLCCLAEFDALTAAGADDLHGEYYFVPGLRKQFTAAAINALIAPRPHLSCAGAADPLTPPEGLRAIDLALRAAYAAAGNAGAWQQCVFATGHVETPQMRAAVLAFLDHWFPAQGG